VVAAYLPYVYFQPQEWMYTRFLLPAIPVMWLLGAAMACDALARLSGWRAAAAGLPLLAALVTWSVLVAHQRDAFALKDGEAKYVEVGRLVNRLLPPDAVVISMQHSGSLRFYTGRRILRWDYLDPAWLDRGVAWLRANGHPTYAVLDLSELEEMKRRYGPARQAAMGRLIPLGGFAETRVYEVR
jgi:hypothetical protein